MRPIRLLAVALALNVGAFDLPGALAATSGTATPQFAETFTFSTPESTETITISPSREEQGAPSHDSRTAPTPDLQGFPSAPAPGGLAIVALPDHFNEVIALFKRLPSEVAGHTRSPQFDRISPERLRVGYGEGRPLPMAMGTATTVVVDPEQKVTDSLLRIDVMDLTKSGFFPINWTAGHVIVLGARHGQETEAKEAGRDGKLFWIRNETFMGAIGSTQRVPVYGMTWGLVDSPWLFTITADTRENRDALLAAFVAAARSSPR